MLKTPEKWTLDTEEKEMQMSSKCKKKAIIHKKRKLEWETLFFMYGKGNVENIFIIQCVIENVWKQKFLPISTECINHQSLFF